MQRSSTVLIADEDGGNVEAVTDEDLGLAPARPRRRRKGRAVTPAAPASALDSVTPDGSLVVACLERSERSRVVFSVGSHDGKVRLDVRAWRAGVRGADGFIPTYKGVQLFPDELDRAIAALTRARELIAAAGEGGSP